MCGSRQCSSECSRPPVSPSLRPPVSPSAVAAARARCPCPALLPVITLPALFDLSVSRRGSLAVFMCGCCHPRPPIHTAPAQPLVLNDRSHDHHAKQRGPPQRGEATAQLGGGQTGGGGCRRRRLGAHPGVAGRRMCTQCGQAPSTPAPAITPAPAHGERWRRCNGKRGTNPGGVFVLPDGRAV